MNLPYIPDEILELMHEFSMVLVRDDQEDIGYYKYFKRSGHYYHGVKSPNHPSSIHHWQIGLVGIIMSQIGGLINMARDVSIEPDDGEQLFEDSQVIELDETQYTEEPLKELPHKQQDTPSLPDKASIDFEIPLPPPILI